MNTRKIIAATCVAIAIITIFTVSDARAECCYFINPLLLPFAVASTVIGTAAAIVSAPFYPYSAYYPYYAPPRAYYGPRRYYGPRPYRHNSAWIPGHYDRYGGWVPGHWRSRAWVPGHYDYYGRWVPGYRG